MGENSAIEWTDHTFNPWLGCTKVSPGCKHCYAEAMMDHRWGKVEWGPSGKRVKTSDANWRKPLQWDKAAAAGGQPARVFCGSLCDVFEVKADQPELDFWRAELFDMIEQTSNLQWLLLTKRPEDVIHCLKRSRDKAAALWFLDNPHVWIGTSAENQARLDERMPALWESTPGVRFLSLEPLLGPINLVGWLRLIDWVIVGGESGPNARRMDPAWVRSLRDQCLEFGVPFFFKQWGGRNKKAAGRLLDGKTWDQVPSFTAEAGAER